jgi:hypothetical protein
MEDQGRIAIERDACRNGCNRPAGEWKCRVTSTFPTAKGQEDSSMNDARRKMIGKIMDEVERLMGEVNAILLEEQEAFENMSGGLPQSEKGETAENAIGYLKQASVQLDNAIEELLCAQEPS